MGQLLVFSERSGVLVVVRAQGALEKSGLFAVFLQVLAQIRPRNEVFGAHGTLVRFLARMNALVPNQIRNLAEFLLAKLTLVWFDFLVNSSNVLLHRRKLDELLVTNFAYEGFFARVCPLMLL